MKVQFGCGGNLLQGWVNHDMDVDLTILPLPYEDHSVEEILIEHCLEHLDSEQAIQCLRDCYRILASEGTLRICCPVVGPWLDRELAVDLLRNHGHKMVLNEESMRTLLWAAGFSLNRIKRTDRRDIDGHWKVIGKIRDDQETCRMEATK